VKPPTFPSRQSLLATETAHPPPSPEAQEGGVRAEGFDPFQDLLRRQAAYSLAPGKLNLRELTPFQRCLLTLDGTVSKYLETYTLEPIQVLRLRQETQVLDEPHQWLGTPPATEVLAREVLLRGAYSATVYAYAVSLLVPSRLPENLLSALDSEPGGIGRALLNSQVENRREILWYGREHLRHLPEDIRACTGEEFLSRAYCIIVQGRPVMLINEKFPAHLRIDGHPDAHPHASPQP
jgi:chorismate-pyruvate lyase